MDIIQGAEWAIVIAFLAGFVICAYFVASVQGDLRLRERSGTNTDEQAKEMFIKLLNRTRRQIDVHDDGNDFAESIYNCPEVMKAMCEGIQKRKIKVRCLFNDENQSLELLELAKSKDYGEHIEIWHLKGDRPKPDIHYKIVDSGRLVHLSAHAQGESEREYRLRECSRWWELNTRRRISRQYRNHFEYGLKNALRAA